MQVFLDTMELRDLEKPDFVQLGGDQSLAVREFPGGNVSIQNLGPTYRPISWDGIFVGTDAYDRMMAIGLMRTSGKEIGFTTELFSIPVMIKQFLPDVKHKMRIPFSITLQRVVDLNWKNQAPTDAIDKAAQQLQQTQPQTNSVYYVVKQGDTLSLIASLFLKDPNKWPQIYQDNQDVLVNGPHMIMPGMVLKINA